MDHGRHQTGLVGKHDGIQKHVGRRRPKVEELGLAFLRGVSGLQPKETITPEDVQDLDVYFVCVECGTEFQVTRIGEVQVPRHCGEPMMVVRRPRQQPLSN